MSNKIQVVIVLGLTNLLFLSGCASLFPKPLALNMVINEIGPVAEERSRVVAYLPSQGSKCGRVELALINMYGYATYQIGRGQGCLFNAPPGDYQFKERKLGKFLKKEESSDLKLEPGKTIYLRISNKGEAANSIPVDQARKEIADAGIIGFGKEFLSAGFIPKAAKAFRPYANHNDQKELSRKAKAFDKVQANKSRIYIIQDMGMGGNIASFYMGLDGPPNEHRMKSNTFYCYEVNPGHHVISGRGKLGNIDNVVAGYYLKTEAGKNYFFRMGVMKHIITEAEGMKLVKKFTLVENGFLEPMP